MVFTTLVSELLLLLADYSCRLPQHIFALICGENLDNELAITSGFVLLDIVIIEGAKRVFTPL